MLFRVKRRSQKYHEKAWTKNKRKKGETAGTYYRNIAGERFKITRCEFSPVIEGSNAFKTWISVEVLKGNHGVNQITKVLVSPSEKIVVLANINEEAKTSKKPLMSLRGRNIFQVILDESIEIGREQIGDSQFKVRLEWANEQVKELFKKFGFKEYNKPSNGMELIVHPK